MRAIIGCSICLCLTGTLRAQSPDSLLTTIASVRQLSVEEARKGYPVRLEGVVTFTKAATPSSPHTFFLQDGDDAIFVVFLGPATAIAPGDWVQVTGRTDPGDFARIVFGQTLQRVRSGALPPVATRSMARLRTGVEDSKWVEVEGVIRAIQPTNDGFCEMVVAHEGHRFRGILAAPPGAPVPVHMLDAKVRMRGVAGTTINQQRQLVGFKLFVPDTSFVTVLERGDPVPSRVQPSNTLLRFREDAAMPTRARLQGTVTLLLPDDQLFVQDTTGGVLVKAREATESLSVGDVVDVVGYPAAGPLTPVLEDASFEVRGASLTKPVSLRPSLALEAENDGRLVVIEATLLDVERQGGITAVTVQQDGLIFRAVLRQPQDVPAFDGLKEGSIVQVTGVLQLLADPLQSLNDLSFNPDTRNQSASAFRVLMRSPDDLVVQAQPPWLTPQRAGQVVIGVLALMVFAIGWVIVLRKRVAVQTETIRAQLQEMVVLKEEAEQAKRTQEHVFTGLSHEFRTPLTLILGPLKQVAQGGTGLSSFVRQHIETALKNSQRLRRLIDQMLDLTKAEAGRITPRPEAVDVVSLLDEIVLAYRPVLEAKHVSLDFAHHTPALSLLVDRDHVEKICLNLLSNAVKFTDPQGAITLSVRAVGKQAVLVIRDTGWGIPESDLARIFDRFYQVEEHATRRTEGSGVGLALVKELVELNGGSIEVTSTVDVGTAFSVFLPLAPATSSALPKPKSEPSGMPLHVTTDVHVGEPETAEVTPPAADPADVATVLVVEDNDEVNAFLVATLRPHFQVLTAPNGKEALRLIRKHLPDVVLSDVMMPEMDGFALAQELRNDPEIAFIPLILLTARVTTSDEVWGLEVGADDYIRKPFEPEVVIARVSSQIRLRHLLRAYEHRETSSPSTNEKTSVFVSQIVEAIEDHLADPAYDVNAVADAIGLSASQLRRRLRQEAGETPAAMLRRMRLERGAQLLQQQVGNVSEVAYGVGFNSLAHFSRCFREHFGVTPSAYARPES